ncbi:MAG: hypothetical protein HQL32_05610 [Planctomycetes bacterium]|nr:hypothetical protein [Planctomycetota bacterium]
MNISLDDIHELLDRQMDDGASFARIRCVQLTHRRKFIYQKSRVESRFSENEELWTLDTLHGGTWGALSSGSFEELKQTFARSAYLANELSVKSNINPRSSHEVMLPKPIRQVTASKEKDNVAAETQDLLLLIDQMDRVSPGNINIKLRDDHIKMYYWDTEHTRGVNEFTNIHADLSYYPKEANCPFAWRSFHYTQRADSSLDLDALNWRDQTANWIQNMECESFRGPAADDLPWVFSPRAFAQLIYGTLRKTLCLERPDPFCDAMNPASIDGEPITAPGLTLVSSPALYSSSSFLDQEGVPAKRVVLLEDGVLQNLVLSRISAFHLSRSLPVHKEKVLAGSSRSRIEGHSLHPDLMYIEVLPGDFDLEEVNKGYIYIDELDVEELDLTGEKFLIRSRNALATKYGGLHKRHINELRFYVNRESLWSHFEGCTEYQEKVYLPHERNFLPNDPYSIFLVPSAKFKGFPCTWS